jgi:hypothetical protein
MQANGNGCHGLDPKAAEFYRQAMRMLEEAGIPFLVGGAYCLAAYSGLERHTKDFDIFVRPRDCPRVLDLFARAGHRTELTFPHWLGKVYHQDEFIDVIFSSGNAIAAVDDGWFEHAVDAIVLGHPARLCPVEETIWSKSYVQERERFDGADVMHLLRARGATLDWPRLLGRFGSHWRILLGHLVHFGFVYSSERHQIPEQVMHELLGRLQREMGAPPPAERVCQGTLLSRAQYLVDIQCWGYEDARLRPEGNMTSREIAHWTGPIVEDKSTPRPSATTAGPAC